MQDVAGNCSEHRDHENHQHPVKNLVDRPGRPQQRLGKTSIVKKSETTREFVGRHQYQAEYDHRHAHAKESAEWPVAKEKSLQLLPGPVGAANDGRLHDKAW